MIQTILNILKAIPGNFKSRQQLALENLLLRQQIIILQRTIQKLRNAEHPAKGKVVEMPVLNGLHHRYYRRAA